MAERAPVRSADGVPRRTVVVVTASNEKQAAAVEQELSARRRSGVYGPDVLLFAVPDPSSARVGSGGATFNALITVQELMSSICDISECLVICVHSGGDSQRMYTQSVCGKAWSALPSLSVVQDLDAPIDLLLRNMMSMFEHVPAGLVVLSSDVLLLCSDFAPAWPQTGATGLAIPCDAATGQNHGVYAVSTTGGGASGGVAPVTRFFQKASVAEMASAGAVRPDGTVLIDSGVIYFSPPATSILLELATTHPFECCTYQGLDCNRRALRIELYSDVMMAMGGGLGLSRASYSAIASSEANAEVLALARDVLWAKLRSMSFFAATVEGGDFAHVGTTLEYLQLLTAPTPSQARHGLRTHAAWYADGAKVLGSEGCAPPPRVPGEASSSVLNSLITVAGQLSSGSVVEHSELTGEWRIGRGCLVSSVRSLPYLTVRDGIAVQELSMPARHGRAITVLATTDPIKDPFTRASARVCGATWPQFFDAAGVDAADIWPGGLTADAAACTLWTAKLWPVFSPSNTTTTSVMGLGFGGGSLGGYGAGSAPGEAAPCDPVTADRASLWLQWLAVPEEGAALAALAASLKMTPDALVDLRRSQLTPRVLAAWRAAERVSLRDILAESDASVEFSWRRALRGRIDVALLVTAVAQADDVSIADLVRRLGRGATSESSMGLAAPVSYTPSATAAYAHAALRALDAVAAAAPADVAGRALAVQSALLWSMAGWGAHGHRSGPAHNSAWLPALALLDGDAHGGGRGGERASRATAIASLGRLRDESLSRAHLIGRAARHYERAAQLLTAQCVYTAPVALPGHCAAPRGVWNVAVCPVRVDLAGGWSDTPPVTYEARGNREHVGGVGGGEGASGAAASAGGSGASTSRIANCAVDGGGLVVNCAVQLDGLSPLGARVRCVPFTPGGAVITVRTRAAATATDAESGGGGVNGGGGGVSPLPQGEDGAPGVVVNELRLRTLADLGDYNQPHAQGALVKCALLCLGVVRLHQSSTAGASAGASTSAPLPELGAQLGEGVAVEVETWSLVPVGSGLGTSSILAAAVLSALSSALGQARSHTDLTHLVLKLEQMLTTGGGWQDQVGGLWPGVKVSSCAARLPVAVRVFALDGSDAADDGGAGAGALTPAALVATLDAHMFLIYTGKTRLAKNLLQRVLRQWAVREDNITETVRELRRTAVEMSDALLARDVRRVGAALDAYWTQKKLMAPLAEPDEVTRMIAALRPHIAGASLCGAGGGGFLIGISSEPGFAASGGVERVLREDGRTRGLAFSVHACTVDVKGLTSYTA